MEVTDTLASRVREVFNKQKEKAEIQRTEPVKARKERIGAILKWIKLNRERIRKALQEDLQKPVIETDAIEILPVLSEARQALTRLDEWVKPRKVNAPLTLLGTHSVIRYEPRGVCLIISPWNYPFYLAAGPLISALAAGNTAVIKPSEHAPATAVLLRDMVESLFTEAEVALFEGGPHTSQALLTLPFDHIFFTGSTAVGKLVMKAAAEHLSSVTLELGGKSPAIVLKSANVKMAARRIAVAKFVNNGQTCVAPDYVLVHEALFQEFTETIRSEVISRFNQNGQPLEHSPHYGRIINHNHFDRINNLIQDAISRGAQPILTGPVVKENCFMHPHILSHVPDEAQIMQEEIFGPVLPVLSFSSLEQVTNRINKNPKPLALYVFGSDKAQIQNIISQTSSGGACVNDCAIHFLHVNLPIGGVNQSGIGKAHGYYGFLAFSNEKPVLVQRRGITSVSFFYPPYTRAITRFSDWLIQLF